MGLQLGLNTDPERVFSVTKEDGKPALRISGKKFGGISTQQSFKNYHLQLEFKWGKLKWHPKRNAKRDSGLLYHAVGTHGADGGFWMRSQEFQIQEGDCGDYWGVQVVLLMCRPLNKAKNGLYISRALSYIRLVRQGPNGRTVLSILMLEKQAAR